MYFRRAGKTGLLAVESITGKIEEIEVADAKPGVDVIDIELPIIRSRDLTLYTCPLLEYLSMDPLNSRRFCMLDEVFIDGDTFKWLVCTGGWKRCGSLRRKGLI